MVTGCVKEMPLSEILNHKSILADMKCAEKKEVFEALIAVLGENGFVSNMDEALKRVMEREDLAVTALGDGVAIPHARIDVGSKPVIAVGRHKAGIDFGSPDRGPVHLIFLVIWQPEQPGLFNRLFGGLVCKLADPSFRDLLMNARGAKEIASALSDVRVDMLAGRATKWEADILVTLQLLEAKKKAGARGLIKKIQLARDELPGSMLSRFDKLAERYGEALVAAPKGICEGCNMQLSSGLASEMQRNPDSVFVCERCGRYIIHRIG